MQTHTVKKQFQQREELQPLPDTFGTREDHWCIQFWRRICHTALQLIYRSSWTMQWVDGAVIFATTSCTGLVTAVTVVSISVSEFYLVQNGSTTAVVRQHFSWAKIQVSVEAFVSVCHVRFKKKRCCYVLLWKVAAAHPYWMSRKREEVLLKVDEKFSQRITNMFIDWDSISH